MLWTRNVQIWKGKNLLIENENLIADYLSNELLYSVMNVVTTISRFSELHDVYTVEHARVIDLEAEISTLKHKIEKDDHRVNSSTEASGSKPRSNTKNNRILPARSDNKKKQVWKATGKLFANVGYQWKPTRRKFTLGEQCPLTRFTIYKVVPLKQPEHVSSTEIVIPERFSNTTQTPLTRYKHRNKQEKAISTGIPTTVASQTIDVPVVQIVLWYLYSGCSKHMIGNHSRLKNFMKKFIGTVKFGNDHFGAIMGYEDYVIGDIVISKVYYVEGLGHILFFVGQFCNSDLEVAFRKHSCYVRDANGVDLLKGSRGLNLYTISVEYMMKSSLICLLSKASKNKSWLWHRRLNHLNFGTINDLARKDLIRGLLRLKF
ncbi:integrase, catalytic region, zinc finger, CCHC-type containing protein [Tanacetum coccineum]